jgi:hypothetical protein
MQLDEPSRRIVVEPLEAPAPPPVPEREPEPARRPRRDTDPAAPASTP